MPFPESDLRRRKQGWQMAPAVDSKDLSIGEVDVLRGLQVTYDLVEDTSLLQEKIVPFMDSDVISIDTETTGLDPHRDRVRLVQVAAGELPVLVVDLFKVGPGALVILGDLLSRRAVKVFQNARFDLGFLRSEGIEVTGQLFDTMLASQLLDAGLGRHRHSLGELARFFLDVDVPKELQRSRWDGALTRAQVEYAARDARITLMLRKAMIPGLKRDGLVEAAKLEFDCLRAVTDMEYFGVPLDSEAWRSRETHVRAGMEEARRELVGLLGRPGGVGQACLFGEPCDGVNPDSPQQVLEALKALGIPLEGTSRADLLPLREAHPEVAALLRYRHSAKAHQAFGLPFLDHIHPITGRLHPRYRQIGASTGRFSCSGPNLQQIPRDPSFRGCFRVPEDHRLIIADYSQVELRVVAEVARDATMIGAFRRGWDLHLLTAALVAGKEPDAVSDSERQAAKAVNFGLVFAMGAKRLAAYSTQTFGVPMDLATAALFRERFFRNYRGVARWQDQIQSEASLEVRTLCGRVRRWNASPRLTEACNTIVQGTAADILKKALVLLRDELEGTGARIVCCVHDEILVETPADRAAEIALLTGRLMEKAGRAWLEQVPVPASVVVGRSWAEK